MKKWETPDMRIFSVKMNENIASSGEGGYNTNYIYYDLGGITRGGADYHWSGNNIIQDTGISFNYQGSDRVVSKDNVGAIAGCLA